MKHLMKKIAMVVLVVAIAAAGYMAYQHYYGSNKEDVKVQFLNFGTDGYNGSYNQGYHDAMNNN
jgi:uncharacterized membrane protein YebE (DUF533 family)